MNSYVPCTNIYNTLDFKKQFFVFFLFENMEWRSLEHFCSRLSVEQWASSTQSLGREKEQALVEEKFGGCWLPSPGFPSYKGFTREDPWGFRFGALQMSGVAVKVLDAGLCRCSQKWPWKTAEELKDGRTKFVYTDLDWKALFKMKRDCISDVQVEWLVGICYRFRLGVFKQ